MYDVDRWHYAVFKSFSVSMWPACKGVKLDLYMDGSLKHGITIVRGDVTCPNCLRMMGIG